MYNYRDVAPVFNKNKLARLEDVYDIEAIKNSIRNIFIIEQNTLPGKPWFGNPLKTELFELFSSTTEETFLAAVENAVAKFEPRVTITDLAITLAPEFNRIIVDLQFVTDSITQNTTYNMAIPFSHNNFTFLNGRETMSYESDYETIG